MSQKPAADTLPTLIEATLPGAKAEQISALELEIPFEELGFAARYKSGERIGEGGMGEIRAFKDRRLGREVAMKMIRDEHAERPEVRARFLREARVQGQLEHPSIVPVYDMGTSPDGGTFFTMKRVRGKTLEEMLDQMRGGERSALAARSRRQLLTAFSSVCLAVDFAHKRGVVHRDLKPSNIMFGDFGEVCVLDWGVAKTIGAEDPIGQVILEQHRTPTTAAGAIMGTPGYMAPEQLQNKPIEVDPRLDVYALGAILFEMLCFEPLHPREGGLKAILQSTLAGVDAGPSQRAPFRKIAPELDAICVRATASRPADRYPSARDLHDAIEAYLDGDRDLELRRQAAAQHARAAEEAAALALRGGDRSEQSRQEAMRSVGRAFALDPQNRKAMEVAVNLLLEPPQQTPHEAEMELRQSLSHRSRELFRRGGILYLSWTVMLFFQLWMGVREWPSFIMGWSLIIAAGLVALWAGRRVLAEQQARFYFYAVMILSSASIAFSSRILSPFILVPILAMANTLGYAFSPRITRNRTTALVIGCSVMTVPWLLEILGAIPPTMVFEGEALKILPIQATLPPVATTVLVLGTSVAVMLTTAIFMGRARDSLVEAEKKLRVMAWQLRQLVPDEAKGLLTRAP